MIDAARFWKHVQYLDDSEDTCWIWTGAIRDDGRGRFWHDGREIRAHWAAWELQHGSDIPDGHRLEQECKHPQCVRHWKLGRKIRKLSLKDLAEIAVSALGATAIARKYGIGRRHVYRIRTDDTHQNNSGRASFA